VAWGRLDVGFGVTDGYRWFVTSTRGRQSYSRPIVDVLRNFGIPTLGGGLHASCRVWGSGEWQPDTDVGVTSTPADARQPFINSQISQ
jgi:hypothetical protein